MDKAGGNFPLPECHLGEAWSHLPTEVASECVRKQVLPSAVVLRLPGDFGDFNKRAPCKPVNVVPTARSACLCALRIACSPCLRYLHTVKAYE